MSMETANRLLADMKLIKSTQNKKPTIKQVNLLVLISVFGQESEA